MILCHCFRVSHNHIKECVAKGACSLEDVKKACRACTGCGGCVESVNAQLLVEISRKPKTHEYIG